MQQQPLTTVRLDRKTKLALVAAQIYSSDQITVQLAVARALEIEQEVDHRVKTTTER